MEKDKYGIESVPEWALCYLINGDCSNLSDEDIKQIDEWRNKCGFSVLCPHSENESGCWQSYFTHYPPFGLACDVVDCDVIYND